MNGAVRAVRQYLHLSLAVAVLAAAGLALAIAHSSWSAAAPLLALGTVYGPALVVLRRASPRIARPTGIAVLSVVQWVAVMLAVGAEPWLLQIVPLLIVLPVVLASGLLDRAAFQRVATGALLTTVTVTMIGRRRPLGPLEAAVPSGIRDVIGVSLTSVAAAAVVAMCWWSHERLLATASLVEESRRRLEEAERRACDTLAAAVGTIATSIGATADALDSVARAPRIDDEPLEGAGRKVQEEIDALRRVAHGFAPADLIQYGLAHALRARRLTGGTVTVVDRLPARPPQPVESALCAAAIELLDAAEAHGATAATVTLGRLGGGATHMAVAVDGTTDRSSGAEAAPLLFDRIAALGGEVTVAGEPGATVTTVVVPDRIETHVDSSQGGERPLRDALAIGTALPVAGTISLVVLQIVLPADVVTESLVLIVLLYLLPTVVATRLSDRRPTVAIAVFVAAHWITGLLIADRLHLVRFFLPVALLLPLVLTLPYVTRAGYAGLSIVTIGAIVAATAIVRFGAQDDEIAETPALYTEVLLLVLVPLTVGLVLVLIRRNNRVLSREVRRLLSLRGRIAERSDAARRRIERDLHDGAQQRLISATLRLGVARRLLATSPEASREHLAVAVTELRSAAQVLRLVSAGEPVLRTDDTLRSALGRSTEAMPIDIDCTLAGDLAADRATEEAVYLCCSEALTNVAKHAGAGATASLHVARVGPVISFTVEDDGRGFDPSSAGHGLHSIVERAEAAGGTLRVLSEPGRGTTVSGTIPVHSARVGARLGGETD